MGKMENKSLQETLQDLALLGQVEPHDYCSGRFFQITDKRYYRCLLDGSILNLDWFERPLGNGTKCPNCKRQIDGSNAGDAVSFSQFKVFRFADGSSVVFD